MRMRKKKNLVPRMQAAADYLLDVSMPQIFEALKIFGNDHPVYIEIGCGKGRFICEHARLHPNANYIGVERSPDVIVAAMERAAADKLTNVRFICCEAMALRTVFGQGTFNGVFLNFSDPWPKNRHEKRRLTYKTYLELYKYLMTDKAALEFKTDNRPLFDYSLGSIKAFGAEILDLSYDLHGQIRPDNIVTEYEQRFSQQGIPINFLKAIL